MGYRGLETENDIKLRGNSRCMALFFGHGYIWLPETPPLMGYDGFVDHETRKPHWLIIDKNWVTWQSYITILPCQYQSSLAAWRRSKMLNSQKLLISMPAWQQFVPCQGICTCWARSVLDVVVVRACSVLTRFLNQLRDELCVYCLYCWYMSRCSKFQVSKMRTQGHNICLQTRKYSNRPVNVICKDGQLHFSFEQWVLAEAPGKIPFPWWRTTMRRNFSGLRCLHNSIVSFTCWRRWQLQQRIQHHLTHLTLSLSFSLPCMRIIPKTLRHIRTQDSHRRCFSSREIDIIAAGGLLPFDQAELPWIPGPGWRCRTGRTAWDSLGQLGERHRLRAEGPVAFLPDPWWS